MKATVFRHMICDGLGSLAGVLDNVDVSYSYVDTYREDFSGFDALEPDLLVVMGGSPGVYQADDYPFLKEELVHIEKRIERDLPVLGVCLGAQMIAHVLGSNVYPGEQGKERGWIDLRVSESGGKSPARHFDKQHTKMVSWHGDTFDLPEGACLLASSDMYENQIFSYGQNIMALQCHAEVTPCILKGWTVSAASCVAQGALDIHMINRQTEEYGEKLVAQSEKFLRDWLALVGLTGQIENYA